MFVNLYTKGYSLHATQNPNADSKNAQNAKIPTIEIVRISKFKYDVNTITKLKTTPIRAAKIFGPALITCFLIFNMLTMYFEAFASGLYFDSSTDRRMKSINRANTIKIF